jgi:hypothetical protein
LPEAMPQLFLASHRIKRVPKKGRITVCCRFLGSCPWTCL